MTKGEFIDRIACVNEKIKALEKEKDAFCSEYAQSNSGFNIGDKVKMYLKSGGRPRIAFILRPLSDEDGAIYYKANRGNKNGYRTADEISTWSYDKIELIEPAKPINKQEGE